MSVRLVCRGPANMKQRLVAVEIARYPIFRLGNIPQDDLRMQIPAEMIAAFDES